MVVSTIREVDTFDQVGDFESSLRTSTFQRIYQDELVDKVIKRLLTNICSPT